MRSGGAARRFGAGTRAAWAAQVAAAVGLAVVVALLAVEVADWWYVRVDLSTRARNSLDPETVAMVERLPGDEPLVVETFLRPLPHPAYRAVTAAAADEAVELLRRFHLALRDRVEVVHHDLGDLAAAQERQRALGVDGENLVVVRLGERRAVLRLLGDLAVVDWGHPTLDGARFLAERGVGPDPRAWTPLGSFRPPRLADWRGELALAEAIARVSAGGAPRACFTVGHGEPGLESERPEGLAELRALLEREGFVVEAWDPAATGGRVPEGCEVLAVVGPRGALAPGVAEGIGAWLDAGGRLVAALPPEEPPGGGGLGALLAPLGIAPLAGVVCEPVLGPTGELVEGLPECAVLSLGPERLAADVPVTEALRLRGQRVVVSHALPLELGTAPRGGEVRPLVSSGPGAWRDLRDARGRLDYALDPRAEPTGRFPLAAVASFPAAGGPAAEPGRRARVLVLGPAELLGNARLASNADLVRNAFDWMVERDWRVGVRPRRVAGARLDLERSGAGALLGWLLVAVLPAACAAVGVGVALARRR